MTPLLDVIAKAMLNGWEPYADWDRASERMRQRWRQRAQHVLDDVYEHLRRPDAKAIDAGKATATEDLVDEGWVDVIDVEVAWPAMLAAAFGKTPPA